MPTILSHGIAAIAIGKVFQRTAVSGRFWAAGVACAVAPDLDVIGFHLGVPYGAALGHRGLSHSLAFAVVLGTLVTLFLFPKGLPGMRRLRIALYLSIAAASHGLLDTLTDGGRGVALLAPFDDTRYFSPWRPIPVSPLGLGRFFSRKGASVLASEAIWIGLPSLLIAAVVRFRRRAG